MIDHSKIPGSEKLIDLFGRWPPFHDGTVLWARLDSDKTLLGDGPTFEVSIHGFTMTDEVDARGYYILRDHVLVHLRFAGVMNIDLSTLSPMLLHSFTIENHSDNEILFAVNFDTITTSALDQDVSFDCRAIEVVSVVPCDEQGQPLTSA